jgi:RNA polymerase sigma-70 factor (ECF subfamily)
MWFDPRKPAVRVAPAYLPAETAAEMTASEALERSFAEHYEPLYRFLRSCGAGDSAAEDCSQDAFLRLHDQLLRHNRPDNIRAWLFRVAYRLWIDRCRHDRREIVADGASWEFWSELLRDPAPSADETLLARERRDWLRRALPKLSQVERQALHLRADGLRYREIAEVLGLTYWSAVEAVRRALDILGAESHGI